MRYWTITFPGECGQHVVETWSEEQILKSYYGHWMLKMCEANLHDQISNEKCIEDWCVIHWAVETDAFGREINNETMERTE